jgi:uncharacterized repeat protein (TIGR03803 family)
MFLISGCFSASAGAATLTRLHNFTDAGGLEAGVVLDSEGNLYGATNRGPLQDPRCQAANCHGTVFKLTPDLTLTTLSIFDGYSGGDGPVGTLLLDASGNLHGTTRNGGGAVFKLAPDGTQTAHHFNVFTTGPSSPEAGVIMDGEGNLYGTTQYGGWFNRGTVYKVAPDGALSILHDFAGSDGLSPVSDLIIDSAGNLYGTTFEGGDSTCHCGTVFKLAPDGTLTTLHAFTETDGKLPEAGVVMDTAGNLYGTTSRGGANMQNCGNGASCGTVFRLAPNGALTVLHSFTGGVDGGDPRGGLIMDANGNLYGTTAYGGDPEWGCGTVFKLAPTGALTTLHTFTGSDGCHSEAALVTDSSGNLYGTTYGFLSSFSYGTVFKFGAPVPPTFSPPAGTYTSSQSVTISDLTPGAEIYYTVDGTTPTTDSTRYMGTIAVSSSQTLKAIAALPDGTSPVASAAYTMDEAMVEEAVTPPPSNPPGGGAFNLYLLGLLASGAMACRRTRTSTH